MAHGLLSQLTHGSAVYRLQLRGFYRRPVSYARLKLFLAGVMSCWSLTMYGVAVARRLTMRDIPSQLPGLDLLVAALFQVLPHIATGFVAALYLSTTVAMAGAAASPFFRRRTVSGDLLTITVVGRRGYLYARYLALCNAFLPHYLLIGVMYWGLAVYRAYEYDRVYTVFYRSEPRRVFRVSQHYYYPSLESLALSALIGIGASLAMLALTGAIALRAATITTRFQAGAALALRLAIPVAGAFLIVLLLGWTENTFPAALRIAGAVFDGGLSLAAAVLEPYSIRSDMWTPPTAYTAFAATLGFFGVCGMMVVGLLFFSVRRLR
jgi:hypothetical protein